MYVLTEDNRPAIDEVRSNGAYTACLLSIVKGDEEAQKPNGKGKDVSDERETTLRVLSTGGFGLGICIRDILSCLRYSKERLAYPTAVDSVDHRPRYGPDITHARACHFIYLPPGSSTACTGPYCSGGAF